MSDNYLANHDKNLMFIFRNITTNDLYHSYAYSNNSEYAKFIDTLTEAQMDTLIAVERGKQVFNNLEDTEWLFINVAFLFIPTLVRKIIQFTKFSMRKRVYSFIDSEKFSAYLRAHNLLNARYFLTDKNKQDLSYIFTKRDFALKKIQAKESSGLVDQQPR